MPRENFDDIWGESGAAADPETSIPGKVATGFVGEKPPYQWQNWYQRRVDRMLQYFERHGLAEWDAATPYEADGLCLGSDGNVYQAVISSTGVDPVGSVVAPSYETAEWRRLFPPATESRAGVVELASAFETSVGVSSDRAVTPAGLSQRQASSSITGLIELATHAEVALAGTGGADGSRAVTPAGLESLVATAAARGIVELATIAETQALSDATRAVTPQGLGGLFATTVGAEGTAFHLPGGIVVQWGLVLGAGTPWSSTITFPVPFADDEYSFVAHADTTGLPGAESASGIHNHQSKTSTSVLISVSDDARINWIALGFEA